MNRKRNYKVTLIQHVQHAMRLLPNGDQPPFNVETGRPDYPETFIKCMFVGMSLMQAKAFADIENGLGIKVIEEFQDGAVYIYEYQNDEWVKTEKFFDRSSPLVDKSNSWSKGLEMHDYCVRIDGEYMAHVHKDWYRNPDYGAE